MKRFLAMLMAALMLLSLAACGGDTAAPAPTAEPTLAPATEAPTEPATEPATEPVTQPATEPITEPATQPPTEASTEPPEDRYAEFCGNWSSTTQFHYMELYIEGGMLHLRYNCFSANATRIAEATSSVAFSDFENNQATFYYSDDGWGNRGSITLDFSRPDQIGCTTVTSYRDSSAQWSIIEGTYTFVRSN